MTEPIEQLMTPLRNVALTAAEKADIRHILQVQARHSVRSFSGALAWGWVRRHSVTSVALALLILLGGTGVTATKAGPNDALNGFRVNVNDRIQEALAFNDDAKIDVEVNQIERDLDEEDVVRDEDLADDPAFDDGASTTPTSSQNESVRDESFDETDQELADELKALEHDLEQETGDSQGLEEDR